MATPQFDFFPRDFLASTIGWPASARGHYITLLSVQWEQGGLPADLARIDAITPGVAADWADLEVKFPICDDGKRRNPRLEKERAYREAKSTAGKMGNAARWGERQIANGSQTDRKPIAEGIANGIAKRSPPSPSPSPSPVLGKNSHTPREASEDFSRPGWAAVAFDEFVAVWNETQRAAPWKQLTAPAGWVDAAAAPGWLDKSKAALAHLPRCRFFETPLALTKFLEVGWADRILAGEFDNAKRQTGRAGADAPRPPASVSSRRWREDALDNMTDAQYAEWCKSQRPSSHAVGLAQGIKRP
jgi:hypothetical protein